MLVDEFLPTYDVSDSVATVVRADVYWTFGVGSGAHVLVNGVIDVVREMAER